MMLSESQTRQRYIDSQLAQAGWGNNDCMLLNKYLLDSKVETRTEYEDFISSYVLLGKDGNPLAIVEANYTSGDLTEGKRHAAYYAEQIRYQKDSDPFIFFTNGHTIHFWDYNGEDPRQISGFFTREDLERMLHQKRYTIPLAQVELKNDIVERSYQKEAIRRVTESMEAACRRFLLVMATGTGKTRTVIALMELLLRARRVQRILFLADRRALVHQTINAIKQYLPQESVERIEDGEVPTASRIHVATYPSMIGCFRSLSPGYYDLIVADESHRSIYNRYKVIFDHFDALRLGLTATPTDFIDHNTFKLFGCEVGIPTFNYSYEQAIFEGYLLPYRVLNTQTNFQVSGIHGENLSSDLQQKLIEQGLDLEELDFEGTAVERAVINSGTTDALVREFMRACRKDALGLPVKSIIFAMSHSHAQRIYQSFNKLFLDYQRRGLIDIIDSQVERADEKLENFKHKEMPRIAISVDMLDTGIDVPEIQNLMFAKPIFSRVKFWQMIGRGMRLYENPKTKQRKKDFLIIDCWNNFEHFQLSPEVEHNHSTEPLPVRLFRLRLEKQKLLRAQNPKDRRGTEVLQMMLKQLSLENINVRPYREIIIGLLKYWPDPTDDTERYLTQNIAPLLRFVWTSSLPELQFRIIVERIALALLSGNNEDARILSEKVRKAVASLAPNIKEVEAVAEQQVWVLSEGFWNYLDLERLDNLQDIFGPLMRFRQRESEQCIELDLPDQIASRRWILYGPAGEGMFADNYRERVEAWVNKLADNLLALNKLKRGQTLNNNEIQEIAKAMNQADLFVTEEILQELYQQPAANLTDFLRHILNIVRLPSQEDKIKAAFERFITDHCYMSASQINFLRAIRSAVLRGYKLTPEQLQQPPLSRIGVIENLFSPEEIDVIIDFANKLVDEVA